MAEYDWEDMADQAVEQLKAFIDTEERFVEGEHELHEKLVLCDYVLIHLNERIPEDSSLHDLNHQVHLKVLEMRELIEAGSLHDLSIVNEETELLQHLEDDVKHRDWKAVKKGLVSELKEERQALRLEIHELRDIHKGFKDIMDLLKGSSVKEAIDKDMATPKQKEEYERQEEHYFVQLHRFFSTYERIFRHLLEKEKVLFRKLKKL